MAVEERLFTNLDMCVPLIAQLLWNGKIVPVTPTDRPTSVRSRCVTEFWVACFVFSLFVVIGLSQISVFFSFNTSTYTKHAMVKSSYEYQASNDDEDLEVPPNTTRILHNLIKINLKHIPIDHRLESPIVHLK